MAHWYDKLGELHAYVAYADKKKQGELREATLRDARKFGWFPSVTTILQLLAKPVLTDWLIKQAVKEALTNPGLYTLDKEGMNQVIETSKEYSRWASEFGTKVHKGVEELWVADRTEIEIIEDELDRVLAQIIPFQILPEYEDFRQVNPVAEATYEFMATHGFTCTGNEVRVFNAELGIAGTVDFLGTYERDDCILDIKTQDFEDISEINWYEEVPLQLGAYAVALGRPDLKRIELCTSRIKPGCIGMKTFDSAKWDKNTQTLELPNSDKAFLHILEAWFLMKNYDPRKEYKVYGDAEQKELW